MSDSFQHTLPVAVYVHLGSSIPQHLKLNLIRHKKLFPEQELVLITSHNQFFELPTYVEIFQVDSDNLEVKLFTAMSTKLDFSFRSGFWKYTLQRFFAINEFHKRFPNRSLTHIESDVLLLPNFPWSKMASLDKLAWIKVSSELDVAAIVHSPNSAHTALLADQISQLAYSNPGINDMVALHQSALSLRSNHYYLPSLTVENSSQHSSTGQSEEENLKFFEGVFDPLNYGLWYFGQDPKNSFGIRKRYVGDSSHDLNPNNSGLRIQNGILTDQFGTIIFSLHVHSKYLPLFGDNWESALKSGLDEAAYKQHRYSFSTTALRLALSGRKAREIIWELFAIVPGVKQLRRIPGLESLKSLIKKSLSI
jgi:hypothetical protein